MNQLADAYSLSCHLENEAEVTERAMKIASQLGLALGDISLAADAWFAVMPHPQGAIHLHYDWFGECFWLTPTGALAHQPALWEQQLKPLRTNFTLR